MSARFVPYRGFLRDDGAQLSAALELRNHYFVRPDRGIPLEQVVINEVEPAVLEGLKLRASMSGRPLQAELKSILEIAAGSGKSSDWPSIAPELARIQAVFEARAYSDSVDILAEERSK